MKPLRGSAFGGLTFNGSYDGMIGELHQKVSSFISHDVTYIICEKSHIWVLQFLFNAAISKFQIWLYTSQKICCIFICNLYIFCEIQTSDVVVSAFDSFYYPVYDVSAYTITDEYGMAIRYPTPQSSIYGHITIFSPGVYHFTIYIQKTI